MPETLQGSSLALRSTRTVRTLRGIYTVYTYEGTRSACESAVAGFSYDQEWEIDDSNAPLVQLSIRTPDDAAGAWVGTTTWNDTYVWEILGNDIQKDIYSHPDVVELSEDEIAKVKNWFKKDEPAMLPEVTSLTAKQLFDLVLKGTTHYLDTQYVARVTRTVGSRFAQDLADTNILRIYTTAQLITEAAVAGTPIPSRLQYKINAIPVRIVTPQSINDNEWGGLNAYYWGWLKKPSTETQRSEGKVQITTEYCLDLWTDSIYPVAT